MRAFVTNMLDYGMDPQAAIDGPRCFSGAEGFEIETGYAPQRPGEARRDGP